MKPIIIAECCQNHNGDKETLKRMIHAAAENGADFVKIQSIRSSELTHRSRFDSGEVDENGIQKVIKRPFRQELERLKKLDLSLETESWFVQECLSAGVAPMTTVFTRTGSREVKDFGYEAVKVASYDCASFPLLRELKRYWSTIFVSTGSTFDSEIEEACKLLQGVDLYLLHCVTIYPTPLEELHLKRLNFLRRFCSKIGYSDHSKVSTTKLWASKLALALGAACIERHFTILEEDITKDGPVSITPVMLKELADFAKMSRVDMMQAIREEFPDWKNSLGNPQRQLSKTELLNRDYYRGRFASKVEDKVIFNWEEMDF